MYFLIGTSLLFTFLLVLGITSTASLTGTWRLLNDRCSSLRPDT